METIIKINTDSITPEFIEGIKKLFPHKNVEITIHPAATQLNIFWIIHRYAKELEDRIQTYEKKKEVISLKADELL